MKTRAGCDENVVGVGTDINGGIAVVRRGGDAHMSRHTKKQNPTAPEQAKTVGVPSRSRACTPPARAFTVEERSGFVDPAERVAGVVRAASYILTRD